MSRSCKLIMAMMLALASGLALAAAVPDISGVWQPRGGVGSGAPTEKRIMRTLEGEAVPLQPWAKELYEQRIRTAESEDMFTDTEWQCLPAGIPRMVSGAPYPLQIVQSPGQVTFLFEAIRNYWIVHLDRGHPEEVEPTWLGDSVGQWQGDTLVIDTIGFNGKTTLDKLGLPHSTELHVVQRIRRTDARKLENIITIEDPKTFTRPWQYRVEYALQPPGAELLEFICGENNRNVPDEEGKATFH